MPTQYHAVYLRNPSDAQDWQRRQEALGVSLVQRLIHPLSHLLCAQFCTLKPGEGACPCSVEWFPQGQLRFPRMAAQTTGTSVYLVQHVMFLCGAL